MLSLTFCVICVLRCFFTMEYISIGEAVFGFLFADTDDSRQVFA